jgi:hypothetical protein
MKSFPLFFVTVLLASSVCRGEDKPETVTIPLDQIWAWRMPGTRDIRSLEPQYFGEPIRTAAQLGQAECSLTSRILRSLAEPAEKSPQPAFIVKGSGSEALKNACSVLADDEQPDRMFSPTDSLTLVFFSHIAGTYVHLKRVSRIEGRIEIQYEFVPHLDAELTYHVALIPLGELPPGQFKTRVVLMPLNKRYAQLGDESELKELAAHCVCRSFHFTVRGVYQGE